MLLVPPVCEAEAAWSLEHSFCVLTGHVVRVHMSAGPVCMQAALIGPRCVHLKVPDASPACDMQGVCMHVMEAGALGAGVVGRGCRAQVRLALPVALALCSCRAAEGVHGV